MRPLELYAILDPAVSQGRDLRTILSAVAAGGGRWVQLRDKSSPIRALLPLARELRALARDLGVTFIVNDRLDLALAAEADGLHVGQDDLPAAVARRLLGPGRILGVSSHSLDEAIRAEAEGADYVAFGSIFPTRTKSEFTLVGLDLLSEVRRNVTKPLVAIGGITIENVQDVIRAGADGAAVISAICGAERPHEATRQLLEAVRQARASETRASLP